MSISKLDTILEQAPQRDREDWFEWLQDPETTHAELARFFELDEASIRRWRKNHNGESLQDIELPRILLWDVETSPIIGYVWGMWQTDVIRIKDDWKLMSVAYKWLGESETQIMQLNDFPGYRKGDMNDAQLTRFARDLLNQATHAVAHNGQAFDTKKLMAKIVEHGLTPPSPFVQIDTLQIARRNFRMSSNKLDSLGETLGVGRKIKHEGFDLWLGCMAGDEGAWYRMGEYAKQDVALLEQIFYKLRPWVKNLSYHLFREGRACTNCGAMDLVPGGLFTTMVTKKTALQCQACGTWNKERS